MCVYIHIFVCSTELPQYAQKGRQRRSRRQGPDEAGTDREPAWCKTAGRFEAPWNSIARCRAAVNCSTMQPSAHSAVASPRLASPRLASPRLASRGAYNTTIRKIT